MKPALVRTSAVAAFLSLSILAACNEEVTDPPVRNPPTLSPATQWAGGTVRLDWEAIDLEEGPAVLTIDGVTLEAIAAGDGWAEYRLPTTARGTVLIELEGADADTFEVDVVGFRSASVLDVNLEGNLLVWPRTGAASVVGGPGDHSGVIQVLPGLGETSYIVEDSIPINSSWARSVGPTYDPDLVLLPTRIDVSWGSGSMDVAGLWTVGPSAEAIDTFEVEFSRHAMLLSDSILVTTFHHEIWSVHLPTMEVVHAGEYEESRGVVVSPGGDYGAVRVAGSPNGPPVFSGVTGNVIFHVDTLFRSYGVDFSPSGDTLYAAGIRRDAPHAEMVFAIDAFSGQVLGGIDLGLREAINIVRDQNGPWLYIAASVLAEPNGNRLFETYTGDPPVMLVVDTRTMAIVGEMATTGFDHCLGWCEGSVAVDDEGVYFVMTGEPARVLAFDVMPD